MLLTNLLSSFNDDAVKHHLVAKFHRSSMQTDVQQQHVDNGLQLFYDSDTYSWKLQHKQIHTNKMCIKQRLTCY